MGLRGWTLLAALAAVTGAQAAPFVQTINTNQTMYMVNVANNNELPNGNITFQTRSLAVDPAGNRYCANNAGILWDITGPPLPLGPTGFANVGDLDYGVNGLWGYSNAASSLFFFDFGTSSVTYSTTITGLGTSTIEGVAYRPSDGSVFLSGYTGAYTDRLFQISPFATSATFVGQINHSDAFSYIADIDFDAAGNLYAITWFHREFYTVNTSTAATTFVSTGPHRDVVGMAFTPVPEPASLAVFGFGLLILKRKRRAYRELTP